jgi:superfamily II DNA/RNA helicase
MLLSLVCVTALALKLQCIPRAPHTCRRVRAADACAVAPSASVEDLQRLEVRAAGASDGAGLSFADFGLAEAVVVNVAGLLGNGSVPNALQAAAHAPLSSGRDAIVHAHTGSGKTLTTLLPLISQLDPSLREPQLLVLCPSRELAHQTARVASALLEGTGLSALALVGGANVNRQLERYKKLKPQVLVGTAGRVAELTLDSNKVPLRRVRHLIIDEVDEALQPPHLDDTLRILDEVRARSAGGDGGARSLWKRLQLVFASATADTPTVRRTAIQLMHDPLLIRLVGDGDGGGVAAGGLLPATLQHGLVVVPAQKQVEMLAKLSRVEPAVAALVFVNSPHRARVVSDLLWTRHGIDAPALRGTQEREERVTVVRGLLEGRLRLVIATEMGARGLDFPTLTHVVNLELPTDERHYVHRAGRCGRAGAAGEVVSLVPPAGRSVVERLVGRLGLPLVPMRIRAGRLEPEPEAKARPASGERWDLAADAGAARPRPARVRRAVGARRGAGGDTDGRGSREGRREVGKRVGGGG